MRGHRWGDRKGLCPGSPESSRDSGPRDTGVRCSRGGRCAGPCAVCSRVAPAEYVHRDDNVQRELRDWGLSFDSNLLSFSGRILQAEKIHQGGKTVRPFVKLPVLWDSGQTPRKRAERPRQASTALSSWSPHLLRHLPAKGLGGGLPQGAGGSRRINHLQQNGGVNVFSNLSGFRCSGDSASSGCSFVCRYRDLSLWDTRSLAPCLPG